MSTFNVQNVYVDLLDQSVDCATATTEQIKEGLKKLSAGRESEQNINSTAQLLFEEFHTA